MITKITFIYDTPIHPMHFEDANPDLMAVARAIPGFQCVNTPRPWPRTIAVLLRRGRGRGPISNATGAGS